MPFRRLLASLLPQHLGGNWNIKRASGAVGRYWRDLYELRCRIVHQGQMVTFAETAAAFEAYDFLVDYVTERLLLRRRRFPRTILGFLGIPGLHRRQAYSRFLRDFCATIEREEKPFWWPRDRAQR